MGKAPMGKAPKGGSQHRSGTPSKSQEVSTTVASVLEELKSLIHQVQVPRLC